MENEINWKEEGEYINSYADFEIEETKEGVLDYIEFITSINGEGYLYSNEIEILKKMGYESEYIN